jgi:hypothetical protein
MTAAAPPLPDRAIVGQVRAITAYAIKHDSLRLPIRAALRDALQALERPRLQVVQDQESGRRK